MVGRSLSVIQGPPGTGKSFFGAVVVETLLRFQKGSLNGPILVTCESNSAVDHFVEILVGLKIQGVLRVNAARGREGQSDMVKQCVLDVPERIEPKKRRACRD